jgi:hypothetical protein
MCVVSNIGDYGRRQWPDWGKPEPAPAMPLPGVWPPPQYNGPTREQFEEFLKLLRAGARFDKATGQPACEQEQKIGWLRDMAKALGFDPQKVDDALRG